MKNKLNCVLLIDDDAPTNFLHKMVIEEAGCAEYIQVCQTAMAALEFLRGETDGKYSQPDLIFLDLNMPVMTGWDFLIEYETLPAEQKGNIIVVMLTTSVNPEDVEKARSFQKIKGFRSKPLTPEMLEEILKTHFADR